MLTFTKSAPGPGFPSTSSLFFEVVANEFFLNDLIGGQPTTCALSWGGLDINYEQSKISIILILFFTYLGAGALLLPLVSVLLLWLVPLVARGRSCITFVGNSFIMGD